MTAEQSPTPPLEHKAADGQPAAEEAVLCVESVARQLVPPQLAAEETQVTVTQDPDAWKKLFAKRREGLGTISSLATGFVRPNGRVERGKRG